MKKFQYLATQSTKIFEIFLKKVFQASLEGTKMDF